MLPIKGLQKTSLVDYEPYTVATIFFGGCNFKCGFCHNKDLVLNFNKMDTITEESILSLLKERKKWLDGVCLTGGEPLLYDLTDFLKKIKEQNLKIKLDTNGTSPDKLKQLIESKLVDYIAMDIKSSRSKYQQATDSNVDIEKIKESIEIIKNSDTDYEFRTTVVPDFVNEDDIKIISQWLKGSKRYFLQQFVPDNCLNKEFEKREPYKKATLEKFKEILEKTIKEVKIRD